MFNLVSENLTSTHCVTVRWLSATKACLLSPAPVSAAPPPVVQMIPGRVPPGGHSSGPFW